MKIPLMGAVKSLGWSSSFLSALSSEWVFTRASNASFFNSAGVLTTAGSNVPAIEFDPVTLAPKGVGLWGQITNGVANPRFEGATPGTPGTAPASTQQPTAGGNLSNITLVGVGTENGIPYVEYAFTTSGAVNFEFNLVYTASCTSAVGQAWTGAFYARLTGGSNANVVHNVMIYELGGVTGNSYAAFVPNGASLNTQRFSRTYTNIQAGTAYQQMRYNVGASGAASWQIRIGAPTLTQTAFVPPVILPPAGTPGVATRAADSLVLSAAAFARYVNPAAGTVFVDGAVVYPDAANAQFFAEMDDGGYNNRISAFLWYTNPSVICNVGGTQVALLHALPVATSGVYARLGCRWNNAGVSISNDGSAPSIGACVPALPTTFRLGSTAGGAGVLNGYIRNIALYPAALTDAQLQAGSNVGAAMP